MRLSDEQVTSSIANLTQNYISYTSLHMKMRGKSYASLIYPIHISILILITIFGYDAAPR
jgi:hypothetical protein